MKTKLITLITSLFLSTLIAVFIINIYFDPYGEYQFIKHKYNSVKEKFHTTSASSLMDKLEKDKYSLIIGSSRSDRISKEFFGDDILNFSTSLYNYPVDVINFLNMLSPKQIKNIKKVFFQLDIHTLSDTNYGFPKTKMGLEWYKITNISIQKIIDIQSMINKNIYINTDESNKNNYVDEYGAAISSNNKYKKTSFALNLFPLTNNTKQLDALNKISVFFKKNEIKVKYFIPPMYKDSFKKYPVNIYMYFTFIKNILMNVNNIYTYIDDKNFTLYNNLFRDMTHLNNIGTIKFTKLLNNNDTSYMINKKNLHESNYYSNYLKIDFTKVLDTMKQFSHSEVDKVMLETKDDKIFNNMLLIHKNLNFPINLETVEYIFENSYQSQASKDNVISWLLSRAENQLLAYLIFNKNIDLVDNKNGVTYLLRAIASGNKELFKFLLHLEVDINLSSNAEKKSTPLVMAIYHKRDEILEMLLNNNASESISDANGGPPLHYAAKYDNKYALNMMLKYGFDINIKADKDTKVNVIGMCIAQKCSVEMLDILVKKGANYNSINRKNESALMYAIFYDYKEAINYFITKSDLNIKSDDGYTALMIAKYKKNLNAEKLLIKLGAH